MIIEVEEDFITMMHEMLRICANTAEPNGPAFHMLAQEVAALGKPVAAITLGGLQAADARVGVRYHSMAEELHQKRFTMAASKKPVA